ncbi:alpha/beta hydrolase [Salipaludibacillus keqinensis]|nr:alpha/beta hydrolase [Salipaludibacillus keqinensis]
MNIHKLLKIIFGVAIVGVILYGVNVGLFYFNQEDILFQEPDLSEERAAEVVRENDRVEEITMEVEEGVSLHGWLLESQSESSDPAPLLIYFGGNSEELSRSFDQFSSMDDWSVLLMNHRGYGLSEGTPSERNLFHDARYMYDELTAREDIDSSRVVVMGRSMGTAPATHLSKERDVSGTILVSPYDTRTRLMEHRQPYLPVKWLIRHPFKLSEKAGEIDSPLLAFLATEDEVIPPEHSEVTVESWSGEAEIVWLEGYDHNDLQGSPDFLDNIHRFLDEVQ